MRKVVLIAAAILVPLAAWAALRNSADAEGEPLWGPFPGLASAPLSNPIDSKDICAHAAYLKARYSPSSVHTAILGYVVEADGVVDNIAVAGTSGSKALDHAIVACVATLRFTPAKRGRTMTVAWK